MKRACKQPTCRRADPRNPGFSKIRDLFRDIAPLLADPDALGEVVEQMAAQAREWGADAVAGVESRGLFVRRSGRAVSGRARLCRSARRASCRARRCKEEYTLEYGTAILEVQRDAPLSGRVW